MQRFTKRLLDAQRIVGKFLATFKDYPQRQKVGSLSLDAALKALEEQPMGR